MQAVVYKGPFTVAVEEVPDARIEAPGDAIVRITTTNICGSDLHMYEGRTTVEEGKVLGHENMGIVEEVGPGVARIKAGRPGVRAVQHRLRHLPQLRGRLDRRSACGRTRPKGWTAPPTATPTWAPTRAARRSTCASRSPTSTCSRCRRHRVRARLHACCRTSSRPGTTARSWPASARATAWPSSAPARSACSPRTARYLRGASRGVRGRHAARPAGPRRPSSAPSRSTSADGDPVEQIMDATGGLGADRGIEAVGYQAHDDRGEEHPEMVLDDLVKSVRATGGIGVVGVYVPRTPGAASEAAQQGRIGFDYGTFFQKGQAHGHRPVPGQAVQPAAPRPDHRGPGHALAPGLARAAPRPRRPAPTRSSTGGRTASPRSSCIRRTPERPARVPAAEHPGRA